MQSPEHRGVQEMSCAAQINVGFAGAMGYDKWKRKYAAWALCDRSWPVTHALRRVSGELLPQGGHAPRWHAGIYLI